ncbi:MAG TPA: MBL fold metallo-hydrolase [Anaerolineae bacterium]|nr:MBL fold metallo-hydrolase [Anaerolineae bacterium]HQI83685.1 MBL fold metallo-hydrolase [Anaerolineae bacterium]
MNAQELVKKLHWLGHDSFRLDGPPVIYFDPWQLKSELPAADLVLVSHHHHDHCSPADIKKISGPQTVVVASHLAAKELPDAKVMRPGDKLSIAGVEIEAVPAYNVNKFRAPGKPFHPQDEQHVGYIVTVEGVRVYFAGDTDHIPEMAGFRCDVALLPVSGTYVMTVEEAVAAARDIQAEITLPMHYGAGIGTADDGERFAELLRP